MCKKLEQSQVNQIIDLYINQKLTLIEVAKKLSITDHTVWSYLKKLGIPRRHPGNHLMGAENAAWKGGRYIRKQDGYVCVRKPDHPRQSGRGYVMEHILVWEEAHNRLLPKGYMIHHLNGIKDDNRPENLVAISKKDHNTYSYVQQLQRRINELETQLLEAQG